MFRNFNTLIGFLFMMVGIILRFTLLILNINVLEFNFLGVIIPFDFLIFIFGMIIYFLYKPIPKKNLNELWRFYEKFKNKGK